MIAQSVLDKSNKLFSSFEFANWNDSFNFLSLHKVYTYAMNVTRVQKKLTKLAIFLVSDLLSSLFKLKWEK